jgi:hypothetical protein
MNIKIINLAMRWEQNVNRKKKVASVASLNQLV